jgi:uncharacterized protein YjlB
LEIGNGSKVPVYIYQRGRWGGEAMGVEDSAWKKRWRRLWEEI